MMADPRIIPAETLADWEYDHHRHAHGTTRVEQIDALLNHGKALAEQLEAAMLCIKGNEMLLRDLEEKVEKAEAKITVLKDDLASMFRSHEEWRHLCEKAEAEREEAWRAADDAATQRNNEKARADTAEQERDEWRESARLARDIAADRQDTLDQLRTVQDAKNTAEQRLADRDKASTPEAIAKVIVSHQRIPLFNGGLGQRCSGPGCTAFYGETDGPNSPRHAAHVAERIARALLAEDGAS